MRCGRVGCGWWVFGQEETPGANAYDGTVHVDRCADIVPMLVRCVPFLVGGRGGGGGLRSRVSYDDVVTFDLSLPAL